MLLHRSHFHRSSHRGSLLKSREGPKVVGRAQPRSAAGTMAAETAAKQGVGSPLPHLSKCIYLDWNATTPVYPEVSQAMLPYVTTEFGNPSSGHVYGRSCKSGVDGARKAVARMVNAASPDEIIFTSCGTESDNWVIYGAVMAARERWGLAQSAGSTAAARLPHVVSTAVEHPAVVAFLRHLAGQGLMSFTEVPVGPDGRVDHSSVAAALTPDTVLVTLMHANNEVGALQPVAEVAEVVRQYNSSQGREGAERVLVHSDAAQSLGKVAVDVQALGVDALTIVGHKFGAPKGVGALYLRAGVCLPAFFHGGGQEGGRRAGTENVVLLAGMGRAAEIAVEEGPELTAHMAAMRDRLQAALLAALPPERVRVNGPADPTQRLPNTLSISVSGLNASHLLAALSESLAASAGAACHSTHGPALGAAPSAASAAPPPSISAVLKAMGVPVEFAVGTLRLSTGRHTTADEVDRGAELLLKEMAAQGVPVTTKGL